MLSIVLELFQVESGNAKLLVFAEFVVVVDLDCQRLSKTRQDHIHSLIPSWICVLLHGLGLSKWIAIVDTHDSVWIRRARKFVWVLEALRAMEGHLEDTNGLVDWIASEHLRNLDREHVGIVHHRGQGAMNLLLYETF